MCVPNFPSDHEPCGHTIPSAFTPHYLHTTYTLYLHTTLPSHHVLSTFTPHYLHTTYTLCLRATLLSHHIHFLPSHHTTFIPHTLSTFAPHSPSSRHTLYLRTTLYLHTILCHTFTPYYTSSHYTVYRHTTVPVSCSREISLVAATINISHRYTCLLYTSPSPRDASKSRMPSSA